MLRIFRFSHDSDSQILQTKIILGLGVVIYMAISLISLEARSAPSQFDVVTPSDKNYQGLLYRTEDPNKFLPAPLLGTDVKIDVSGIISRVRVRHFYMNPTDNWVEGIYVFPLADKSAVDTLTMRIGERVINGVIEEKKRARKLYDQARKKGKRAALLESHRPNIFKTSVANISPNDGIIIEIAYQETLAVKDSQFRLRFPMVVGPRHTPRSALLAKMMDMIEAGTEPSSIKETMATTISEHGKGPINPVNLTVRIAGNLPIKDIKSHHHSVVVNNPGNGPISIKLKDGPVPADRDFELTWSPDVAIAKGFIFTEERKGERYGLVMMTPPTKKQPQISNRNRETIFIIDTSGSMAGPSLRQAKTSLLYALEKLGRHDRFNVIQFNSNTSTLFRKAVAASKRNVLIARRYIDSLEAGGGTNMLPAIRAALNDQDDHSILRQVIFITDGAVSNESEMFQEVSTRLGSTRLFTVGIGSAPNQHFMRWAAKFGRGTFTFIGNLNQAESRMKELWQKLSTPVVTDISIKSKLDDFIEAYPDSIPDLFMGEPVVFTFKAPPELKTLKVQGKGPEGLWVENFDLKNAPNGTGISKLWAREKIEILEAGNYWGVAADKIREDATEIGLKHGLVTRYTSLVAIDET
ncbi:MAG: marine proteobacterial sortase target protein, partial [Rhodospirillaceae bacterium]|nr:marine proteobacterial sortase target protein [Rhodospirillaceae bacterium]